MFRPVRPATPVELWPARSARPRGPRRAHVCAAAALALLALAAASRAAAPDEAAVRREIEGSLAFHHLPPDLVDVGALAREAVRRLAAGASRPTYTAWLNGELRRAWHAFAPPDARQDPRARYALPFDPRIPRLLAQGVGDAPTHTGRQRESFDFVMPAGTPVLAAREGVVARVVDGFTTGSADAAFSGNQVLVLHADGTFAIYLHLSPGIPVKPGRRVNVGDVLGKSGGTGRASAPHLHFAVSRLDEDGIEATNVPIRFGPPGSRGYVPKKNEFVGAAPQPTVVLAVAVGGRPTPPEARLRVRAGDRLPIRVSAPGANGAARALDGDPHLELISMTPWNLTVERGAAVIEPMPGFTPDYVPGLSDVGVLGVYWLRPGGEVGLGQVQFQIDLARGGAAAAPAPRASAPPRDPGAAGAARGPRGASTRSP